MAKGTRETIVLGGKPGWKTNWKNAHTWSALVRFKPK